MGQYWQIACPDEQLKISLFCSKLGEIFPGGLAGAELLSLLLVPRSKQDTPKTIASIVPKLRLYHETAEREVSHDDLAKYAISGTNMEEELSELLYSIYRKNWLHATKTGLGEYLTEDDIPPLVRLVFDGNLGCWANKRIIYIGDYSDKLPEDYKIGPDESGDTLYDAERDGIVTLSDCAKSLLNNLSSNSKLAEAFQREYSRVMEESFPSMEQHVLLNLTAKEYVLASSDFGWRELGKRWDNSVRSLGDAAISQICWSQYMYVA